ncbi:MAG: [protein-PII] uridylyltransferase [Rhodopirellula sp.]|nr:[protein-PII] uridylyltransferase [Rhodopirellula sp.]
MPTEAPAERIQRRKRTLEEIRLRAAKLLDEGALGMQIASWLSDALDNYTVEILKETLTEFTEVEQQELAQYSAMIAIGGSGRGEVAPYSDSDLIFIYQPRIANLINRLTKRIVPEFWDAGIKLGQRVHTVRDAAASAISDPHLASSLVHVRSLWGDDVLAAQLKKQFYRKVVRSRLRLFVNDCIEGRDEERITHGNNGQQLEPDVKKSLGGLRDVHLLQWIAFAHYQTSDIDSLRRKNVLTTDDAVRLKRGVEFLTRVRIDLHLHAGKANDTLSKDEQLRIAESREISHVEGQKPVERFMQEYFSHSMAIAEITQRFVSRHRRRSVSSILKRLVMSHRVNRYFVVSEGELDVAPAHLTKICTTLDDIVRIYHSAATYRVSLSPRLIEAIKSTARNLPSGPSPEAARLFMEILGTIGRCSETIRSMHNTNVLELIIPEWQRVRCLLQFNQYHHFTVDEHTLRCLDICESFKDEDTPVGAAYRNIHVKQLLHLALILHDAGKGFEEDHSELGCRMSLDICQRLRLTQHETDIVSFLVHKHLKMADLSFRYDTTDPRVVLEFSHDVGSAEKLRMLFVLTAADVSGVGPGVWTSWKADLLADFYKRLMTTLSGQPPRFHEEERLREIREHVYDSIVPLEPDKDEAATTLRHWVDKQLDGFSSQYLTMTPPSMIARDLDIIRSLKPGEIRVDGRYDATSGTTDYHIIADSLYSQGGFHRISGVLTARHMQILGAEITTSSDGIIVDTFHVVDEDFSGAVPQGRIDDVANSIVRALRKEITVKKLFQRHRRYVTDDSHETTMGLPTRVEVDTDTSGKATIVLVFAHDRPGLLYTISRTLFKLDLSIDLARISTHFDQVVDVFYVTDYDGRKITSEEQCLVIRDTLLQELSNFENSTHRDFVS